MTTGRLSPGANAPTRSVWRNHDFNLLMVGSTGSSFGAQISIVAVPLVAVITVGATSLEVGLMRAAGQIPYLLLVLVVGLVVDRWPRRNILISAHFGRAAALSVIPIAFSFGNPGISTLYVVAFLVGVCTVLSDVGSQAYLPRLVERSQLAQANSVLETARSAALIGGPAMGGAVVSLFAPPTAVIACVVFFLLSAGAIWRIRKPEPARDPTEVGESPLRRIGAGFRFVRQHPLLRPIAIITAFFNFCFAGYTAIYLVYLPVELGLPGYAIGLAFAAMGPGLLVGALFSSWLPRQLGYGRVLLICAFASNVFLVGVSLLRGPGLVTIGLLVLLNFMYGCLSQTLTICLVAIRQSATPDRYLGRVMATLRFLGVGLVPLGSLFGGFVGLQAGLRPGLFAISLVMCAVPFLFIRSALMRIGPELPAAADE